MRVTKLLFLLLLGFLTLARAQPAPGGLEQPGEEPQLTVNDIMGEIRDDQGVDRDDQLDPQACDPSLLEDLGDALMHKYFIVSALRNMAEDIAKGITGAGPRRQHVQLGLAYVSAKVLGIMALLDGAAQSESRQFFEPSGPGGDGGSPGDTGQYAEGDTGDEGGGGDGDSSGENGYGGGGFAGLLGNRSSGAGGSGGGSGEAQGYQGGGGSGFSGTSRNRSGAAGRMGSGGSGSYGGSAGRGGYSGSYQEGNGGTGDLAMENGSASGGGGQGSYPGQSQGGSYSGSYRGRGGSAGGSVDYETRGASASGYRGASAAGRSGGRPVVGGPVGELVGQIANVRLILLVVALVVLGTITVTFLRIVRFFRKRARRHAGEQVVPVAIADPAMTLLKERFVKDEITREEFEKKKRELEEMSGTPAEPEHKHGHVESKPKLKDVGGEVMEP